MKTEARLEDLLAERKSDIGRQKKADIMILNQCSSPHVSISRTSIGLATTRCRRRRFMVTKNSSIIHSANPKCHGSRCMVTKNSSIVRSANPKNELITQVNHRSYRSNLANLTPIPSTCMRPSFFRASCRIWRRLPEYSSGQNDQYYSKERFKYPYTH